MSWANFYLVCFLVGFLLSLLSLLLSNLQLHVHLPGGGHGLHMHTGHVGAHVAAHGGHAVHGPHAGDTEGPSPLNFASLAAFLAWFGGSGYLLARYSTFWSMFGLGLAVLFGLAGGALVFAFLARLASRDENLDPMDYDMVGVLGRVTSGIHEGGTGEIVYSQEGTRHTCGARSEDGSAIERGTEIVVTRYEKGLAYVREWKDMVTE